MKTAIFFLLNLWLSASLFAQTGPGKPMYDIVVKRADTLLGKISVELFPLIAPKHVANFDSLVNIRFYDSTAFHRVVTNFVIQGGDPNSKNKPKNTWGTGDPSQVTVPAEFSLAKHQRGTFAAARSSNINSATSQFYICVSPQPSLDTRYTIYGRTVKGMDVVDKIVSAPADANGNPNDKISMFISKTGLNDSASIAPLLNSPGVDAVGVPYNSVQFLWKPVSDAVIYHLEVSLDSLFTLLYDEDTSGSTSATRSSYEKATKFFWRVRANNGGKMGAYSEVRSFTTNGIPTEKEQVIPTLSKEMQFLFYPNPANTQGKVHWSAHNIPTGKAKLYLYDNAGKLVFEKEYEASQPTMNEVIDINHLGTGVYSANFVINGKKAISKIVIQ